MSPQSREFALYERWGANLAGRVAIVTGRRPQHRPSIALELAAAGAAVMVKRANFWTRRKPGRGRNRQVTGGTAVVMLDECHRPGRGRMRSSRLPRRKLRRHRYRGQQCRCAARDVLRGARLAEWREVLSIILDGAFLMSKAAQSALTRSENAAIISIGGLSAHTGAANRAHVVTPQRPASLGSRAPLPDLAPQGNAASARSSASCSGSRRAAARRTGCTC